MILATNNKGKLKEIKDIFDTYEIYSLKEKNINIDIVEDATSFYGNAYKKAKEIYELTNEPVIADDSGICITNLNNFPGVETHRFLGEDATDEDRNNELVKRCKTLSDKSAKVICTLVYYDGKQTLVGEGILEGTIVEPRGENGFGFDPIFELSTGKTLAELSSSEKNKTSARYLAALDLKEKLQQSNI